LLASAIIPRTPGTAGLSRFARYGNSANSISARYSTHNGKTKKKCKLQLPPRSPDGRAPKSTQPMIWTTPSGDNVEMLDMLHRMCDWVVTVDRKAVGEYFDSLRDTSVIR
jgi:hypothetical protein